ncbi:MAG: tetratricopeptide repeat protein [Cyclobacteriaceae bacterium]|nr:tetratricopeptide repeat protein [Cyclobacteriaceae bacterium]
MRTFLICLLLTLSVEAAVGQSSNPQKSYLNGKELYNKGQFALAIEAFKPLTTYSNAFSEYATYFYGLSAYHDGQNDIAKNIFLQLTRKYPNWAKKNEALFWLGKLYFEKEEYQQGVTALREIRDRNMTEEVSSLKKMHLQDASLAQLKTLHKEFPNDSDVGESLAKKLAYSSSDDYDQELFEDLMRKFNFKKEQISDLAVGPTVMKERYRVAVCFPFMTDKIKGDTKSNSNQWVLDLYQGIKIGQDELKRQSVSLEIFAYDTKRDSTVTAGILSQDEMRTMDLIIGPLYPQPSELAADFSITNQVNILNPLSSNLQIVRNNPYSFLYNPGEATMARAAAEYMVDHIDKKKKVLIISGSRPGDSVSAYAYQQTLMEKDIEIVMMDPIPTVDSEEISKFISQGLIEILGDGEENGRAPKEEVGHIYVASTDELIITNVIGMIDIIGPDVSIMGHENWLRSRYIDYAQLERMEVYLAAPAFLDYTSDNFKRFHKKYVSRIGSMPNRYSFMGYDMIMLFGKLLAQGGTYFQHELQKQEFFKGILFPGYSYQEHNDNQYVPIVKFEEGLLTQVNQN